MTVLRLQGWLPANRRLLQGAGMVLAAVLVFAFAATVTLWARADASVSEARLPPAHAAELLKATIGDSAQEMSAIGEEARLINAALPFSSDPILAARPFEATVMGLDARRAELCLTQAVYYEAGFEPAEGRRAVAQVIVNRARHPAYPKSICGVVYQKSASNVCQFTFVCDGSLYRAPVKDEWEEAGEIARAALTGHVEASVGQATHYHAVYVSPRWAPLLSKVAQLGQHIFYRWPGAWGLPAAFSSRYAGEPLDPLTIHPAGQKFELGDPTALDDLALARRPTTRVAQVEGEVIDGWNAFTLNIPAQEDAPAVNPIAEQDGRPAPTEVKTATAVPAVVSTP